MKPFHLNQTLPSPQSLPDSLLVAQLEKRIEIGERRFDLLFRAYPTPTYVWQRQGNDFILIDYNDAAYRFTNGGIRNLIGLDLRTLYGEYDGVIEDFERCQHEKIRLSREISNYRMRTTGETRDMVVTLVPVEPDLVLAITHDVTAERQAYAELKKLSSAVEQTADAVFITDRSAVIEYVNPAFEQMTGYPREEVLGKTPRVFKSGKMPTEYYYQLWKSVLEGKVFRTQTTNRKRNGELFIVEQTITPMKDDSGKVTHFVSVLKDMTDRIHLQEEEAERRLAGIVQKQLFPSHPPQVEGYDIAGAVFPANVTSGDYYDYIQMPENTTGFVVADVCDHGMGSALIMAEVRAYLRSLIRYESDLQRLLGELNTQLQPDLADSNFITLFMARLDPLQHSLEYANAGNWPAHILDRNGKIIKELRNDGYPIGLFPNLKLRKTEPISLEPGNIVLFLTDGIPDASNAQGQVFGLRRILNIIRRHPQASAQELVDQVRQTVVTFMGTAKQDDDQTIIICKRRE